MMKTSYAKTNTTSSNLISSGFNSTQSFNDVNERKAATTMNYSLSSMNVSSAPSVIQRSCGTSCSCSSCKKKKGNFN